MMENNHAQLKARLFDLMDEKEKYLRENCSLREEIFSLQREKDEIRGELNSALNVAKRRAEMIRDISKENRTLRNMKIQESTKITPEIIDEVSRALRRYTNTKETTTKATGGFVF